MKTAKIARILCLVLALTILLSVPAFATTSRASKYLASYYATISETSDGNLSIYFNVIAPAKMEHLGANRISVQRYTGSYWRTEYNFTYSEYPELQGENVGRHSGTVVYEPQYSNSSYRAVVTFYSADSTGSDTGTYTAD